MTLFWDEPEANLNPALLKRRAAVLAELARQGFQIILATHSLFLMKELHMLSRQLAGAVLPVRYFGLNAQPGEATHVTTVDDFEDLPDLVALDVALAQGEEFLNGGVCITRCWDDGSTDSPCPCQARSCWLLRRP